MSAGQWAMRWNLFALTPRRRRQLWYVPLLGAAMALVLLRLLVLARLLDVPAFAAFSVGLLVSSTYCIVGTLGLHTLLQRDWPVLLALGRGRTGTWRAAQCNLVGMGTALGCCALAGLGLGGAGVGWALVTASVLHGLAQQAFLVATTESRSEGDALRYGRQQLLRSATTLVLGATVAAASNDPLSVLAAEALATGAQAAWALRGSLRRSRLGWRAAYTLAARRLRKVGWPAALTVLLVTLVSFGLLNAERWVGAHLLAPVAFAHYAFAAVVLSVAQALQALVNASIYPLLARRFASAGAARAFGVCLKLSVAIGLAGLLVAPPLLWLLGWGVQRGFPQYQAVLPLLPWLVAVGLLRLADFWSSFLMIAGRERRLLMLNLTAGALAALGWGGWWLQRPDAAASPLGIAVLALMLSGLSTIFAAAAAWRLRHGAVSIPEPNP